VLKRPPASKILHLFEPLLKRRKDLIDGQFLYFWYAWG
jgi:hypothetical protein